MKKELKNKDAVRLWNENEKLKHQNKIMREALEYIKSTDECASDVAEETLSQLEKKG